MLFRSPNPPPQPPRSLLRPSLALDLRPRFARTSWTSTTRPIAYQTSIDRSSGSIRTKSTYSADSDETILPTSVHRGFGIDETRLPAALRRTAEPSPDLPPPTPPKKFLRHVSDSSFADPPPLDGPLVQPLAFHPFRALSHKESQASLRTITALPADRKSVV